MKIQFKAHQATDREVELTQQELFQLFEMMREEFENHITYSRFNNCYPSDIEKDIVDFCNSHNVDVEYGRDRINFFTVILNNLKNPYQ